MVSKRYTLSLPTAIYDEVKEIADERDLPVKVVVRQCLKFGLIAMKAEDDPNTDIVIRKSIPANGNRDEDVAEIQETMISFL